MIQATENNGLDRSTDPPSLCSAAIAIRIGLYDALMARLSRFTAHTYICTYVEAQTWFFPIFSLFFQKTKNKMALSLRRGEERTRNQPKKCGPP